MTTFAAAMTQDGHHDPEWTALFDKDVNNLYD